MDHQNIEILKKDSQGDERMEIQLKTAKEQTEYMQNGQLFV